jgi:hypothetical protein
LREMGGSVNVIWESSASLSKITTAHAAARGNWQSHHSLPVCE